MRNSIGNAKHGLHFANAIPNLPLTPDGFHRAGSSFRSSRADNKPIKLWICVSTAISGKWSAIIPSSSKLHS
jgi:hypothetical protein